MSAPETLELGSILSKSETDSPFFLDEESDEKREPFLVSSELIATGRTCVIGSSGSGKSYSVGVICEELCKCKVPFVIIDIEGEYSGLKEKYEAVWVGEEDGCDLRWSSRVDLKLLAHYAPDCPPLILDISEAERPREKVSQFLIAIYREISKRRTPYLVVLEEADRFSPQKGERLPIFDEIARRGRKRGLGLMLCTQRPSLVDKNILSQCSNQLIGKLVIKNDLQSVAQFFSSSHSLPNQLTTLSPGEFFALGGLAPEPLKVKMRTRKTRHGGITPKLNPATVRPSVEKILETLQAGNAVSALEEKQPVEQPSEQVAKRELPPEVPIAPVGDSILPEKKSTGIFGLAPRMQSEAVPSVLRLEKSYKLFGQKENVAQVELSFRPLLEIAVRIRSGILKKKFETRYFLLDGVSGKLVSTSDRLLLRAGIEKLVGLEEGQITVLKALHPDRDMSLIEVAGASGKLEDDARRLLKGLEDKRLVRSTKMGRSKMFRRLLDIPKIVLTDQSLLTLSELNPADGTKLGKVKIKESDVREVVKGLWEGADLEGSRQFFYPMFRAEIVQSGRARYVWLDGITGKELEL